MKTSNKIIASVFAALLLAPSVNALKAGAAVRYDELDNLFQATLNGILGYTSLKNAKNISTIAYGAYLGNAALILTVYIWLMFFSGETSSLYGETVKYYTATA